MAYVPPKIILGTEVCLVLMGNADSHRFLDQRLCSLSRPDTAVEAGKTYSKDAWMSRPVRLQEHVLCYDQGLCISYIP
jgi:hypothetical protein